MADTFIVFYLACWSFYYLPRYRHQSLYRTMLPCESPVMICMKVDYQVFKVEFRDYGDYFSFFAVAVRVGVVKGFVGQLEGHP